MVDDSYIKDYRGIDEWSNYIFTMLAAGTAKCTEACLYNIDDSWDISQQTGLMDWLLEFYSNIVYISFRKYWKNTWTLYNNLHINL